MNFNYGMIERNDFTMYYLTLLPNMIGHLSVLALVTYLCINLTKTPRFRKNPTLSGLFFGLAYGLVAIYSTNYAVTFKTALVNMRDAAPLAAGLIFGPAAGIIAGVIGALERLTHYGNTTVPCSIATLLAGLVAALLYKIAKDKPFKPTMGLAVGALMQVVHMALILLIPVGKGSSGFVMVPFETELEIVTMIALPMMFFNALGLFIAIAIHRKKEITLS